MGRTLLLALAMTLPVALLGAWLQIELETQASEEQARKLESESALLREALQRKQMQGERAAEQLCRLHRHIQPLADAAKGAAQTPALARSVEGAADAKNQPAVAQWTSSMTSALGVDRVDLLALRQGRKTGLVLHSSDPIARGQSEPGLAKALGQQSQGGFVLDRPRRHGKARENVAALIHACPLEGAFKGQRLVVSQYLDEAAIQQLLPTIEPARISVIRDSGAPAASIETSMPARRILAFDDSLGRPTLTVFLGSAGSAAAPTLALGRPTSYVTIFAFIVALLLAARLRRGGAAPLDELQAAVARVADGDWSSSADVSKGGELGRVLSEFNRMTDELRWTQRRLLRAERIAAWREIARRIAHEIKNPLSPIQVSIETMRKTYAKRHPDFDEIFEESTLAILEEVERLKRIVTEFSDFARMPRPHVESLQIGEVIEHVTTICADESVAIDIEASELPPIRADREQVAQVLMNLVQNAIDAARDRHGTRGGRVEVLAAGDEDGVVVAVRDNGPGIASSQQEKIFEPYFTTKSTGTGLGLAIVQRIVGDHGGAIEAGEGIDGGAELRFFLPREGPPMEATTTFTDTGSVPPIRSRHLESSRQS